MRCDATLLDTPGRSASWMVVASNEGYEIDCSFGGRLMANAPKLHFCAPAKR
jgi:hypothetical protein